MKLIFILLNCRSLFCAACAYPKTYAEMLKDEKMGE